MQKDQQGRMKPVAYASKSLTDAEKRYSNIEHETTHSCLWLY